MSDDERDIRALLEAEAERGPRPQGLRRATVRRGMGGRLGLLALPLLLGASIAWVATANPFADPSTVIAGPGPIRSDAPTVGRYIFSVSADFAQQDDPVEGEGAVKSNHAGVIEINSAAGSVCLDSNMSGATSAYLRRQGDEPWRFITIFDLPTRYRPSICARGLDQPSLQGVIDNPASYRIEINNKFTGETLTARLELMGPADPLPKDDKPDPWPSGPVAHNCSEENSDAEGDFDGDGAVDQTRFEPAYTRDGRLDWTVRLELSSGQGSVAPIRAECPEMIGAVDIDRDGDDELFFDTGAGMTAALVDVLVFADGKLKNVDQAPKGLVLYVGSSNSAESALRCFKNRKGAGFTLIEKPPVGHVSRTTWVMDDDRLVRDSVTTSSRGPLPDSAIDCFGLRWLGY